MMNWWRFLPAFIRVPVAIGVLCLATYLFMQPAADVVLQRGRSMGASLLYLLGLILLFTGPTDAQKKGYHD